MRFSRPARSICAFSSGSHQTWKVSTATPTAFASKGAARSRAWPRVEIRARSAAYIGCSGSSTSRTPFSDGERNQVREAVGDALAGSHDVLLPRRQAADHQEQFPGVQRHGFEDGGAVVGERGGLPLGVGRGQEAAAAQRGDPEAGVLDQLGGLVQAGFLNAVPPRADRRECRRGRSRRRPRRGSISWWWRC